MPYGYRLHLPTSILPLFSSIFDLSPPVLLHLNRKGPEGYCTDGYVGPIIDRAQKIRAVQ